MNLTKFQSEVLLALGKKSTISAPQMNFFFDDMLKRKSHLIENMEYEKDIIRLTKLEADTPFSLYSRYLPIEYLVGMYKFQISTTPKAMYTPTKASCA